LCGYLCRHGVTDSVVGLVITEAIKDTVTCEQFADRRLDPGEAQGHAGLLGEIEDLAHLGRALPFGSRSRMMAGVAHPSGVMPPVRSNAVVLVYPLLTSPTPRPGNPRSEVILVPEDPPPDGALGALTGPDIEPNRNDVRLADGARLTNTVVGHLTDQARRTANAAKAGRVVNAGGEPGVLDLTPLRELLSELVEELQKVRLRDRVASALRQAADIIDSQTPGH
jgi:hypothetical protein